LGKKILILVLLVNLRVREIKISLPLSVINFLPVFDLWRLLDPMKVQVGLIDARLKELNEKKYHCLVTAGSYHPVSRRLFTLKSACLICVCSLTVIVSNAPFLFSATSRGHHDAVTN
jgi:hypothetical protein